MLATETLCQSFVDLMHVAPGVGRAARCPVACPNQIFETLRDQGARADNDIDLTETALQLALLDYPDGDVDPYQVHLADLARDTAEAAVGVSDQVEMARRLSAILADLYGYDGDQLTFDDPYNANLISVIDRRRGLPVSLGILYLHAGRSVGWAVSGLNFPGHFLVCVGEGDEIVVIDPFHSGRILTEHELNGYLQRVKGANAQVTPQDLGMMSNRAVLVRLLNNIKERALKAGDAARALEIAERLVVIAPRHATILYDFAMLNARAGHLALALDTLRNAAQYAPNEPFRQKALGTFETVKRRLN